MTKTEIKPGWKTTEFYGATAGSAALLETARQMESPWVQAAGIVAAGMVLCLYVWSRAKTKETAR